MYRTTEDFRRGWDGLEWMVCFHKRPYWIFASVDDYHVSVIRPRAEDLPFGTVAILYDDPTGKYVRDDLNLMPIDRVVSSRKEPSKKDGIFRG